MLASVISPFHECLEEVFQTEFGAKCVNCWEDVPSLHTFFSRKLMKTAGHLEGILGYTFYSRKVQMIERPEEHPAYNDRIDHFEHEESVSLLVFALRDNHGNAVALLQIFRFRSDPFGIKEMENAFLDYFCAKFSALFPVIDRSSASIDREMIKLLQFMDIEQFLLVFQKLMESMFHCRKAEIWRYDQTEKELFVYHKAKSRANWGTCGIVGEAITRLYPVNCLSNRIMSSYNPESDGTLTEPVLAVPISNIRTNVTTAVVLRGGVPIYTHQDQELLGRVASYVVLGINNLEAAAQTASIRSGEASERKCLDTLQSICHLVQQKATIDDIITEAVESMEIMTHADRSSIFALDRKTSALTALFSTGKDYPKVLQSNRVVPARVFTFGQVINLQDAYEDIDFDSAIDLETGYRTRSVLAVPMLDSRSEVLGCAEFLNRTDGMPFLNADVKLLKIILMLLGTAIDADRLKQEIATSTAQLWLFFSIGMSFLSDLALQNMLMDTMKNLRRRMEAQSIVIYLLTDDELRMKLFLVDGVRLQSFLPMMHGVGALAFKAKEVIVATDAKSDPRFIKDPFDDSGVTIRTIMIVPIVNHDGSAVGVVEIANKSGPFTSDEINAMKSFGGLVALSLGNRDMSEISEHGNVEFEMDRWIEPLEKVEVHVPQKLCLMTAERMEVDSLKFECADCPKVDLFKAIFWIFAGGLLTEFAIKSETMFSFLYSIRETYLDIRHHNWVHAVDVFHFVHMLAVYCRLDVHITKLDLLCLYIAALCQDAGHQGYSPATVARDELSTEVLNKGQSAESVRHCAVLVNVLAVKENNILKNVPVDKVKNAWDLILRLMMGTDMASHFQAMKAAKEFHNVNWKEYTQQVLALTLLLKMATVGFMFKDVNTCIAHLSDVRVELGLDRPFGPEEDLFGGQQKFPPEIRRKKEILAFGHLIVAPLARAAAQLMDGVRPLSDKFQGHIKDWILELYPPQEESTSIVIGG
jgi:GAF domain-containing protein